MLRVSVLLRLVGVGILASTLAACAVEPVHFDAVSTKDLKVPVEILQKDVEVDLCPDDSVGFGDYEKAAKQAIASVPGANALINASFARFEDPPFGFCVKVHGDAARI